MLFHNILTEMGGKQASFPNTSSSTKDLSRAPRNRYISVLETKGLRLLINRHWFQQMSPGDLGSSRLPICTHLKAVGDTVLGGRGQGACGFSHITLKRILTAQKGRLWDASQAKH